MKKLSTEEKKAIIKKLKIESMIYLHSIGFRQSEIALMFGVTQAAVSYALKKNKKFHVGGKTGTP